MELIYILSALAALVGVGAYFYLKKKDKNTQKEISNETPNEVTDDATDDEIEKYNFVSAEDGETVYWYADGAKKEGVVKNMPQGLQVFDENGNLIIDIGTHITKALGEGDTGTTDGSIVDDRLNDGAVWVLITERLSGDADVDYRETKRSRCLPNFTNSGNTITWKFNHKTSISNMQYTDVRVKFLYGIY